MRLPIFLLIAVILMPFLLVLIAMLLIGNLGERIRVPVSERILLPLMRWAGKPE